DGRCCHPACAKHFNC
uniref:Alpha-conotoxin-like MIA n=1 Tax=Conus magus TaxID=6492 RepID=CA1A_CONMA|nr:RecName: Full=Alpha-conotoxin-like MIA [Conus magus]